ncbi:MAG: DUF4402 domain-containing protein [Alphaproteobacteria bacterium]|nr:DUF4402 domain-containing protein [Alphaproteobacteria bacterium]MBN2780179.1 DUF4402 domain-containing protein [Alphaproteobacteria bacterium]
MKFSLKTTLVALSVFISFGSMGLMAKMKTTAYDFKSVNFGEVVIDPALGARSLVLDPASGKVSCPVGYVCRGAPSSGIIRISGQPSTLVHVDVEKSRAVLGNGVGGTITFDPVLHNDKDKWDDIVLDRQGRVDIGIGGMLFLTGNESSGLYSTNQGREYRVNVLY